VAAPGNQRAGQEGRWWEQQQQRGQAAAEGPGQARGHQRPGQEAEGGEGQGDGLERREAVRMSQGHGQRGVQRRDRQEAPVRRVARVAGRCQHVGGGERAFLDPAVAQQRVLGLGPVGGVDAVGGAEHQQQAQGNEDEAQRQQRAAAHLRTSPG